MLSYVAQMMRMQVEVACFPPSSAPHVGSLQASYLPELVDWNSRSATTLQQVTAKKSSLTRPRRSLQA